MYIYNSDLVLSYQIASNWAASVPWLSLVRSSRRITLGAFTRSTLALSSPSGSRKVAPDVLDHPLLPSFSPDSTKPGYILWFCNSVVVSIWLQVFDLQLETYYNAWFGPFSRYNTSLFQSDCEVLSFTTQNLNFNLNLFLIGDTSTYFQDKLSYDLQNAHRTETERIIKSRSPEDSKSVSK